MSDKNLTITTLYQLLNVDCVLMLDAERQLKQVLPKWIDHTDSIKLKTTLQKYLDLVNRHVDGLHGFLDEQRLTNVLIGNRTAEAMIAGTNEKISYCSDREVINACLLEGVQILNHYKICTYGTAAAFAGKLELVKDASFFHEAEVNEKQIDDRLSQLAEFEINPKATAPIVLTL